MRQRLATLLDHLITALAWGLFVFGLSLLLSADIFLARDTSARVRNHIRDIEFDFVDWTLAAAGVKLRQASLGDQAYLDEAARTQVVREYFEMRSESQAVEGQIAARYADPSVTDPAAATVDLRTKQADLHTRLGDWRPLAEAILQEQLSTVLADQGLVVGGQPIPPASFHMTPLPLALVVSPRAEIRQEAHLDVSGELTVDEQVALEERVARDLDVSTLLVQLGGIGAYPTMVAPSSDLNWTAAVIAHEWLHNYLTLRPLGINYDTSPELRTMNETTAELIGNEIGALVIERYYPERKPPEPPFENLLARDRQPLPAEEQVPAFDFRAEMHTTRVKVDELLAEGRVAAAEAYMEARRRVFWDHGYQIRKLNQAYFAFYGAYAAEGGGAAGADPVGVAVRLLRRRSATTKYFVDTMAGFTSFEQLQAFLSNR